MLQKNSSVTSDCGPVLTAGDESGHVEGVAQELAPGLDERLAAVAERTQMAIGYSSRVNASPFSSKQPPTLIGVRKSEAKHDCY